MSIGQVEEKVSLYADDALLYLSNTNTSLREALSLIDTFGSYSGVCVNWGKSVLFALRSSEDVLPTDTPLQRVSQLNYLGVVIHWGTPQFIPLNLSPVLSLLTRRCTIPHSFFQKQDSLLISFVWNGGTPRIAKNTLQLPEA